jgi:hypothetical protein
MSGPLLLPNFHVLWKEKSLSNRVGHLPTSNIPTLQDRITFVHRSAINKKDTIPRLFGIFLMLKLLRNLTGGLLKISGWFVFALFR